MNVHMDELAAAIAECLSLHAEAVDRFGTEMPEEHNSISEGLRTKMRQARVNVSTTLEGHSVEQHALHINTLCRGLRLVMRRID